MVYIDKVGHLAADTLDELHEFAALIGLIRNRFQEKRELSHYDCTAHWRRNLAVAHGAHRVSVEEMPAIVRKMNTQ
jgi:hypothetical protein